MIKRECVISLGINNSPPLGSPRPTWSNYARGLSRIHSRLKKVRFPGSFIAWDKDYPSGSPSHARSPFGFKPFCFLEAMRQGYHKVLWVDASVYVKRPLDSLFEVMERRGYVFFREWESVGEFCKDEALTTLGISREESFSLPSCWGCSIGLDLTQERSVAFLDRWAALANDGVTFPGPKWSGVHGFPRTASSDPRVRGHRHDQTAASVVALKLGMDQWLSQAEFEDYFDDDREYVRRVDENTGSAWMGLARRLKMKAKRCVPKGLLSVLRKCL